MMPHINIFANADTLEPGAKTQFDECCSHPFVLKAALMPDAHTGYVAPIGSVIKTNGAIVPAWVGYDIGCGMIAVKMSDRPCFQSAIKENAQDLFKEVNTKIPMGAGGHNQNKDIFYLIEALHSFRNIEINSENEELRAKVYSLIEPNLGTLGSGNHFIEILEHHDETWLVIHSGSRGLGHYVGTYFMKAISGLTKGFEATYAITDETMKKEYMLYQEFCLQFALLNRMSMSLKIALAVRKVCLVNYDTDVGLWVNKNHNHCIEIAPNIYLHRKGATSSDKGERGVIPANMRDGCYLVEGLGNEEFLNSSSHGAGRALSRGAAKRTISLETFKQQMEGIVAPVNNSTIDESPLSYKNITEVMELQKDSVKVIKHLKPIINWKG